MVSTHLKNISQIGSSPQAGVKIKNIWNHHLVTCFLLFPHDHFQPKNPLSWHSNPAMFHPWSTSSRRAPWEVPMTPHTVYPWQKWRDVGSNDSLTIDVNRQFETHDYKYINRKLRNNILFTFVHTLHGHTGSKSIVQNGSCGSPVPGQTANLPTCIHLY